MELHDTKPNPSKFVFAHYSKMNDEVVNTNANANANAAVAASL